LIKLRFKTKKGQKEILDEAIRFFQKNTGLKITESDSCSVLFGEMYTNYVMVSLSQEDDTFEVTVESREHEYTAQKFAEEFKKH
jgi:hypothetical protein